MAYILDKKDKGRVKKKRKIVCKITHLGGWVAQEWDKLHRKNEKNMPLKSILDHFNSF